MESDDDFECYTQDQVSLASMIRKGDLAFEDEAGYPLLYECTVFYEDGRTIIKLNIGSSGE